MCSACIKEGMAWQSSGKDSGFFLLRAGVQSLVGELRSYKLCGAAKNKKGQGDCVIEWLNG